MATRERLSASVEGDLLDAGRAAVAEGRAESLSAWVNEALRRQADHDGRLRALGTFVEGYEAEHGRISEEEIDQATRTMRGRALVVRTSAAAPDRVPDGDETGAA